MKIKCNHIYKDEWGNKVVTGSVWPGEINDHEYEEYQGLLILHWSSNAGFGTRIVGEYYNDSDGD